MKIRSQNKAESSPPGQQNWKHILPALLIAGTFVVEGCGTSSRCGRDTDCKGDRICDEGRCISPTPQNNAPNQSDKRALAESNQAIIGGSKAGAQAYFSASRGGPGSAAPVKGVGPAKKPELLWQVPLGSVIFATPRVAEIAVRDGASEERVFVGTHAGRFLSLSLRDNADPSKGKGGEIRFDQQLDGSIWGSPAIDSKGVVYVGTDGDHLHAIDGKAGKLKWSLKLGDCVETRAPGPEGARCDVDGGPTIGPDGDLYVGADALYRISPEGEVRWRWEPEDLKIEHVFSSPLLVALPGPAAQAAGEGRIYVGLQGGAVVSLTTDGVELWRYKVGRGVDVDGSPALGPNGEILIGADNGRMYAIRSDGSLKWSFLSQRDIRSAVAVDQKGNSYLSSFDGNLYALDAKGAVRWVFPTGASVHSSPVIDGEGKVFVGSQSNDLFALSPDGKLLWSLEFPDDVDSSVALSAKGALVVGCDDGVLRAFGNPN